MSCGATAAANVACTGGTPSGPGASAIAASERLDDPLHAGAGGAGRDERELVAADPRQAVAVAHHARAGLGDRAQDRVARRVAVLVVDGLEAVEVEEHERGRAAVLGRPRERVVEAAAVEEARQRVALGHAALHGLGLQQAILEVVHREGLAGDRDEEEDAARRIAELDRRRGRRAAG